MFLRHSSTESSSLSYWNATISLIIVYHIAAKQDGSIHVAALIFDMDGCALHIQITIMLVTISVDHNIITKLGALARRRLQHKAPAT